MTDRLYYIEQRQTAFTATIVDRLTWDGQPAVVLDKTAFYPTSGGQPADRGELDGVPVLDVIVRDEGGEIVHVLAEQTNQSVVRGTVDWERRFDHMQQHTGQHVLSAAFERVIDADTVGFHLGSDASTIDVDAARLDPAVAERVEGLANRVVWEDRPVHVHLVESDALAGLPLRRPTDLAGPVRIVAIGGTPPTFASSFDVNPCGGTHVSRTGEIGIIKVVRLDYRGHQTRIEFLCGARALNDYQDKSNVINLLAGTLTVGYWELGEAVGRLRDEARDLRRQLAAATQQLIEAEAAELIRASTARGEHRVVARVLTGRTPADLRSLALALARSPGTVALLASVGERTQLCFARSDGVEVDVAALLRRLCARLDGKGGGRPHLAQGSAKILDPVEVEAALSELVADLPTSGG